MLIWLVVEVVLLDRVVALRLKAVAPLRGSSTADLLRQVEQHMAATKNIHIYKEKIEGLSKLNYIR